MEYTYVFSIAGQVLRHLSSPVFQEVTLVWGLGDDLRKLKNTISSVEAVILDAQDQQSKNHQLKDWLQKLENAFYRAQDVLEDFEIYALRSNRIIFRFKMAHKIKKIREEFNEIAADRNSFNLIERLDEKVVVQRVLSHSFVRNEDVVGRDKEREAVISFLMATTNDKSLPVLPIIGLGGMGKTTLAKLVFNDERVQAHFDLKIWVCIPEFEIESVIKAILKSAFERTVTIDCDKLQLEQLQQCLREKLAGQKYLLILDDVWNENHVKWMELRNLLTGGASESRIIITTRNQSAASVMAPNKHNIELEGLSHDLCMSLFCKWAFGSNASRYPHLVEIAESIIKKCKGVPLALRTLGSILYLKTDESDWINVRDNEIWKIEQNESDIMPALKLSYYQLPTNLRQCFAFCCIFPKDYVFDNFSLTKYWKANGLLQQLGENQNPLEAGMTYIQQLLSRGFFQDFEDFGGFVEFKMHDFVHDLALLVGGSDFIHLNSLEIHDPRLKDTKVVRNISLARDCFNKKKIPGWLLEQKENMRTVNFPNGVGDSKASFIKTFISKFKSLRWLDLNESSFKVLPSSIGSLKHLKHLNLSSNSELKALPASVCELVGLESLLFDGCLSIERLPRGLGQLTRLQRLAISTKESHLPENEFRCLTSLTGFDISDCPNLKFVMSDDAIQCLSSLHLLTINRCGSLVSLPVRGLSRLTRFDILFIGDCALLDFTTDNNNNNSDNNETENGGKEEGICTLRSLTVTGLPKLESLPLCLLDGANNLKFVCIEDCDNLTTLMPEQTLESLKSLQRLWIINCPKLKSLLEGIRCLTALNEVKIWECPQLLSRCQRETGKDWHKICHVPNIYLDDIKI